MSQRNAPSSASFSALAMGVTSSSCCSDVRNDSTTRSADAAPSPSVAIAWVSGASRLQSNRFSAPVTSAADDSDLPAAAGVAEPRSAVATVRTRSTPRW